MEIDAQKLADDPAQLKQIIVLLSDQHRRDQQRIQRLEEHVRLLQNEIFGRKTEKHVKADDKQILLFGEDETPPPEAEQEPAVTVAEHSRKKRGRKPLPADLPRVDITHDIDEFEKSCECGCQLKRIGQDVCEQARLCSGRHAGRAPHPLQVCLSGLRRC